MEVFTIYLPDCACYLSFLISSCRNIASYSTSWMFRISSSSTSPKLRSIGDGDSYRTVPCILRSRYPGPTTARILCAQTRPDKCKLARSLRCHGAYNEDHITIAAQNEHRPIYYALVRGNSVIACDDVVSNPLIGRPLWLYVLFLQLLA